jgi:crotonobetainyl-CoA:carnitine CoA-transferase CaiB-like acyl-CoA transferase
MSPMPAPDAKSALTGLLHAAGLDDTLLNDVTLTGREPALPSSFAVGTAAQTTIAASAVAAAELWRQRTGRRQHVGVDLRHAAIEFRSERYLHIDGKPYREYHDDLAGLYRCSDGRWAGCTPTCPIIAAGCSSF